MKRENTGKPFRERLDAWAPAPVRLRLLLLLIAQCVLYWGAKCLTRNRVHHMMALPLDGKIPQLPWTVIIYFGCFLFWAVNYAIALREELGSSRRFFCAELCGKVIAGALFVAVPATLVRPEVTGTGVFPWILRFLYRVDAPDALFPSVHCFNSWMCFIGVRGNPRIPRGYRVFSAIMAVLVFAATLTTKQHVIVDVAAGVALAELTWHIFGRIERRKNGVCSEEKEKEKR